MKFMDVTRNVPKHRLVNRKYVSADIDCFNVVYLRIFRHISTRIAFLGQFLMFSGFLYIISYVLPGQRRSFFLFRNHKTA